MFAVQVFWWGKNTHTHTLTYVSAAATLQLQALLLQTAPYFAARVNMPVSSPEWIHYGNYSPWKSFTPIVQLPKRSFNTKWFLKKFEKKWIYLLMYRGSFSKQNRRGVFAAKVFCGHTRSTRYVDWLVELGDNRFAIVLWYVVGWGFFSRVSQDKTVLLSHGWEDVIHVLQYPAKPF